MFDKISEFAGKNPEVAYGVGGALAGAGLGAIGNVLIGKKKKDKLKESLKGAAIGALIGGVGGVGIGYFKDTSKDSGANKVASVAEQLAGKITGDSKKDEVKDPNQDLLAVCEKQKKDNDDVEKKHAAYHKAITNSDGKLRDELDKFDNMTFKQLKEIRNEYSDDWYDWLNFNKYLTSSQRDLLNTEAGKAYMNWRAAQEKSHYHDVDNEHYTNAPFNRL